MISNNVLLFLCYYSLDKYFLVKMSFCFYAYGTSISYVAELV